MIKMINSKYFSIIELMVVISIILILSSVGLVSYLTIRESQIKKAQLIDFGNIKTALESISFRETRNSRIASNKFVKFADLIKEGKVDFKISMLQKDEKLDQVILSRFNTPIDVYVAKTRYSADLATVNAKLAQIKDKEKLTGEFLFYYGKDHEEDGNETATGYGLVGMPDEGNIYHYKFVTKISDDPAETGTMEFQFFIK